MDSDDPTTRHLAKTSWTQDDLAELNWHDTTIWAFRVQSDQLPPRSRTVWPVQQVELDVDYITRWVSGATASSPYSFWVAPATVVFRDVAGLRFAFDMKATSGHIKIIDMWIEDGRWQIDGMGFSMQFSCTDIAVAFRSQPMASANQTLELEQRGGISFEQTPVSPS